MICAAVREGAKWVSDHADFVKINTDKIPAYTASLLNQYPIVQTLDAAMHAQSPAYVLALDSINFGSGYFKLAQGAGLNLEYDVIAKGLKRAFDEGRMDTPEKWLFATAGACHDMCALPRGVVPEIDALMQKFADHLAQTGRHIVTDFGGDVEKFIVSFRGSAVAMATHVAQWPSFFDAASYKDRAVPVFKRAQILAADLNLVLKCFNDIDQLTIFADNMVPHVLRCDGILEYAPALAEKIDSGAEIAAGGAEETELRCCAIHAVELMRQSVTGVTTVNLDHILWGRGYEIKTAHRQHRTLTTAY